MRRFVFSAPLVLALVGCAGDVTHQTDSGRPEATIAAPVETVKAAFVGTMVNEGFALTKDTGFQVVVEKLPTRDFHAALMTTSRRPHVAIRFSATFIPTGKASRIVVDTAYVAAPGTGDEFIDRSDRSNASGQVQIVVDRIKTEAERGKSVGSIVAEVTKSLATDGIRIAE